MMLIDGCVIRIQKKKTFRKGKISDNVTEKNTFIAA